MALTWVHWALLAAVAFGTQITLYKVILDKGLTPLSLMTISFTITSIILWIYSGATERFNFQITNDAIIFLILLSLIAAGGNVASAKAVKISPNPGYAAAVWSSAFLITTFLSIFIFKLNFEIAHILGVLLIFAGIVFLSGAVKL